MSVTLEDNVRKNSFKENAPKDEESSGTDQQKLLHSIAAAEGFTGYDIEQTALANKGGNYLGILFQVTIRGKRFKDQDELRLFVKAAASNKALRDLFPLHDVYCNEIFVYKVLSRIYDDLQTDESTPADERYEFTKFFGSIETDCAETIVLDDLTHKHYKVVDRFKSITLEFATTAVDKLAKFHALSYALERRDPGFFEDFIKRRKGNMYLDGNAPERLKQYGPVMTKNSLNNLRLAQYSDKLRNFCESMSADIRKYVKVNRRQVLCHGDYRVNNMLVKYEDDRITSLIPIDYQLVHFGSPLNDLIYFIFGATDKAFRAEHFDYLVQYYYSRLGEHLGRLSCDVAAVYPKSEFEEDLKSHMMFGLVVAVHVLPFILVAEQDAPDVNELNDSCFEKVGNSTSEVYKERFNEIVEDFVEWGYL